MSSRQTKQDWREQSKAGKYLPEELLRELLPVLGALLAQPDPAALLSAQRVGVTHGTAQAFKRLRRSLHILGTSKHAFWGYSARSLMQLLGRGVVVVSFCPGQAHLHALV